jgi:hypothetical protein
MITVMVTLGAIGATTTASAVAHEFNATEMGKLTLKAVGIARFRNVAGAVECKKEQLITGDAALSSKTQHATIEYTGCTAFGLAAGLSPAKYEFNAEGTASLLNTVTAKSLSCLITFPSAKNQSLHTVKYLQTGKQLQVEQDLTGITSVGVGAGCSYAEESNGTFSDTSLLSLASGIGSVEWK